LPIGQNKDSEIEGYGRIPLIQSGGKPWKKPDELTYQIDEA